MPQQTSTNHTETLSPRGVGGQWRSGCISQRTSNVILQPYKDEKGRTVQILHDERVRIAWKAMRLIQKHFMRAEEENATPEARANVAEAISVYNKNIELVFGMRACTYNLHMLNCM